MHFMKQNYYDERSNSAQIANFKNGHHGDGGEEIPLKPSLPFISVLAGNSWILEQGTERPNNAIVYWS